MRDNHGTISKVQAVEGDIQLPGLGLSQAMRSRLARSVDYIIHCAADIRLEPTIHETLQVRCLRGLQGWGVGGLGFFEVRVGSRVQG